MTTKNNNNQPQPQPQVQELPAPVENAIPVVTSFEDEIVERSKNYAAMLVNRSQEERERQIEAIQAISEAKQKLAFVADCYKEGSDAIAKSEGDRNQAILSLSALQSAGQVTKAQVSSLLGDQFGFVLNKDGKPGKTPMAPGSDIRKRIVRLVDAMDFASGKHDVAFFADIPGDKLVSCQLQVASILDDVADNGKSPWSAYDDIAKIKTDAVETINAAFDPAKVTKLVETLSTVEAFDTIKASPALLAAYEALAEVILVGMTTPTD